LQNFHDLQVAQALHEPGKKQHAQDEQNRHQQHGKHRHCSGPVPIDPSKSRKRINEGGDEGAERMKQGLIAANQSASRGEYAIALN
jgi:hypothetical protein